jgi:glyoxylase-like metal-dependent hydrolase (beta-lactamase superfamily II)
MELKRIPAGALSTNCYIVMDENSREAFILDPGGDCQRIVAEIEKLKAEIKFILLTHGHFDHTGAAMELSNKYDVTIYINEKDLEFVEKEDQLFIMNGYNNRNITKLDKSTSLKVGNLEITCIETPGHTPGGMCYLISNVLLSGDTLFAGSIGRTDFNGGNHMALIESIKNKLLVLPGDTIVMPGHGLDTTIENEKNFNPFF